MLQVAFGQSKYFSDNLVENVKRGIRQKIRRGEWLTLAPFGYVNNLKTKNIEPDKVKSRIIKRAFEEYATGTYTLKSLADFLADHGVVQKKGTPLAKVSVVKMLTNRAYLGFIKHRGEWHNGNFEPILSPTLFEAVQKVLTCATVRVHRVCKVWRVRLCDYGAVCHQPLWHTLHLLSLHQEKWKVRTAVYARKNTRHTIANTASISVASFF